MKILVTGSAGFLGSHLVDALKGEGHDVVGVDNMFGGEIANITSRFYYGDTADFKAMDKILSIEKPDIVYHCACTPYEGLSVFCPALASYNTFQNTVSLLSASVKHNVKRFIFTSSMGRYGNIKVPYTEDMIPQPEDPYAASKIAAETVIKQMSEIHGIEYAIAIPHNIIGSRQKYDDPFRNVASIFINRNLRGLPSIIYGDGEQQRSFSFVDDCVYPMVRMIDCPSGEAYNIGPDDKDGELNTINQLAEVVSRLTGFNEKPVYKPDRPSEVKIAFASSDKIRKHFNFKKTVGLEEGITGMIEDIKKRGPKPFDYSLLELEIINDKIPTTWSKREM